MENKQLRNLFHSIEIELTALVKMQNQCHIQPRIIMVGI